MKEAGAGRSGTVGIPNLEEQIPRRLHSEDAESVYLIVDDKPRLLPDGIHAAQQKLLELEINDRTTRRDRGYYNVLFGDEIKRLTRHPHNRRE